MIARKAWRLLLLSACLLAASSSGAVDTMQALLSKLAGAAEIEDRFERDAALYRLLADTDRNEILSLLDTVQDVPEAALRSAVSRPLYIRLTHFDAETAADHVLARDSNLSALIAVFRAWAHVDLAAATARAATLQSAARETVARTILELDLSERNRAFVLGMLDPGNNSDLQGDPVISVADDTWVRAWSEALQAGTVERERRMREVAAAWAASDPVAAVQMAAELPGIEGMEVLDAVVEAWGTVDPDGPVRWLARGDPETTLRLNRPYYLAVRSLADDDPDLAMSLLSELPQDKYRSSFYGLAKSFAENHPDRAIMLYESFENGSDEQASILNAMSHVATWDDRRLNWLASLPEWPNEVEEGIKTAYFVDRDLLLNWLAGLEDPVRKAIAARAIAEDEAALDPSAAWQWAGSFENDQDELLGAVYREWHARNASAATRAILDLKDRESRTHVAREAIEWLLDVNGPQDGDAAERLFRVIESEALRRELARQFADYFAGWGDEREADRYRRLSASGDQ